VLSFSLDHGLLPVRFATSTDHHLPLVVPCEVEAAHPAVLLEGRESALGRVAQAAQMCTPHVTGPLVSVLTLNAVYPR